MTEAKIEMRYEAWMDTLDRLFMEGGIDQETYDREVSYLNLWVNQAYKNILKK
jgi:hypothetical protein